MLWKFFDPSTPVLVQGITGKEGSRMAAWMVRGGTRVVAGVTPGKGGQTVQNIPVYNNVKEARDVFPDLTVSCVVVPGAHVLSAVQEALDARVTFVHILTENVPVHDALEMRRLAQEHQATILGPSSVGYLQFPRWRVGYLGGQDPFNALREGSLGVISASGGMANELLMACGRAGIGVRLAIAVGGDRVPCLSLEEALRQCDALSEIDRLLVFAEPGNPLLNVLMDTWAPTKPTTLLLAGDALETLPRGMPYGHTGTILGEDQMFLEEVRGRLQGRGIACVKTVEEWIARLQF